MSKSKHYLITLELIGPCRMHAYVMTNNRSVVDQVCNEMADFAEANKLPSLNIILITILGDGAGVVRKILRELGGEQARKTLKTAKHFHRSIWLMDRMHPSDEPLMKLH